MESQSTPNLTSFLQSDDPVIQFRRNNSDASVPVGGYEIMWIDIYIPPGSLATYEVEAFAPGNLSQTEENTMFLCDLRLIQVAKNSFRNYNYHASCTQKLKTTTSGT